MTFFAQPGPIVAYGQKPTLGAGAGAIFNRDLGPSAHFGGAGLLDARNYGRGKLGWLAQGSAYLKCLGVIVPATAAVAAIAAAAATVAGTPFTLVSVSGAGVVINTATKQLFPGNNIVPITAVWIDAVMDYINFGLADGPGLSSGLTRNTYYDPTKMLSRVISVTGNAGSSAMNVAFTGFDIYGFPMTETIAFAGGAVTTNGKKAWKAITSATPDTTDAGHLISIGTTDLIGLPLRTNTFSDMLLWWGGTAALPGPLITAVPTFAPPVTTDPATAVTGDVRGTFTLPSASDGTKALAVAISLNAANLGTNKGHFGVTQA